MKKLDESYVNIVYTTDIKNMEHNVVFMSSDRTNDLCM